MLSSCVDSLDIEDTKKEMLTTGNMSCTSYNLQSRNDQGITSMFVSSRYKEGTRFLFLIQAKIGSQIVLMMCFFQKL